MDRALKARAILQIVSENTQKKLEFQISNLVSMAIASIFPLPYKFQLKYVKRRNKIEADLIFSKNGNETDDILNSGGGGVADVVSNIALRIAARNIKKNRPVLILDEPTKFLHNPDYQEKASILIKKVSQETGLQIIMVSDQPEMIAAADKEIKIINVNGVSFIEN